MSPWWGVTLMMVPIVLFSYSYFGYPLILWLLASNKRKSDVALDRANLPRIAITVPCYNEEQRLAGALRAILEAEYPPDRREIVVVSDASSDGTDAIAASFAAQGVRLIRLPQRSGKTAAEHCGIAATSAEIVINVDASVLVERHAIEQLVAAFSDPTVGVASSRDVSVGDLRTDGNRAESGYVDYEMRVRDLETRLYSIVGASGSFFAMRREVHQPGFPESLSRDFASALLAVEQGYRGVSVEGAICFVPRTQALHREYHRKVRTMARGLQTLWHKRQLLNPHQYGVFAWMLISHKLCRWLTYLTIPIGAVGLGMLAVSWTPARYAVGLVVLATLLGVLGILWPTRARPPVLVALPGFALASGTAGIVAWMHAIGGRKRAIWEPTRRGEAFSA